MLESLYNFKNQFTYVPHIENNKHKDNKTFVICGMGGSAISARILKDMFTDVSIEIHSDYGVPDKYIKKQTLVIISSFSGNTEETLDAYHVAIKAGYRVAVVTSGGTLLGLAKTDNTPYIQIPQTGLEPRFTVGYQMLALLELMSLPVYRDRLMQAGNSIDPESCNKSGLHMAEYCANKYPTFYTGTKMQGTSYAIVAAIHEGAKRPSVLRILPESNHNELESYSSLSTEERFQYMSVFASNSQDHIRIKKRIETLNQIYLEQSLSPYLIYTDSSSLKNIIETLLIGYFFATHLALQREIDPYKTELIANFKSRLA